VIGGNGSSDTHFFFTLEQSAKSDAQEPVEFELASSELTDVEVAKNELTTPELSASLDANVTSPLVEMEKLFEPSAYAELPPIVDWKAIDAAVARSKQVRRPLNSKIAAKTNTNSEQSVAMNDAAGSSLESGGESSMPSAKSGGVTFFGSRAAGKKFVFVVDASGSMTSMNGIRWKTATDELLRSLNELTTGAEYFVICFNAVEYPIFNHYPPNNKYLKNEPQTLRLVQNWIAGFRPGGTTLPSRALQMAITMKPDAIFLLSDGELRDDSIWMLRNVNRDLLTGEARIPIHTILLMSAYGHFTLETIAHENRGEFRSITMEQWLAARIP